MFRDRLFLLLLACFFLSGLAALVYETAWTREFAFVFGTSELAVATVLAAYMGGLAVGAALAGRFAPRVERPVLVYGLLELGIALSALAVPFAVAASRALYVAIFGGQGALDDAAGGSSTAFFYLLCSFAILLVPTAMMGATLPLLARHAVEREDQLGSRVGLLYAVNTGGAVAGTLLAAFLLLPAVGLRATIWIAAAINALVFLAAWALARASASRPVRTEAAPSGASAMGRSAWILPLIFGSGIVSFGYEVLWVRLMSHVVGASIHAFATMLASFLLGIALGSAVASRFASSRQRAALGFALAQLGIAALSLAAFAAVDRLPGLGQALAARGLPKLAVDSVACIATLFPAALCIGATFPFAVRIAAKGRDDAAASSARVYAANTLGSIVGAIAAGFFLVPGLGFAGAMALYAGANLALAAGAALLFEPRRRALLAVAAAGGMVLAVVPPSTPWSMLRATSFGGPARGKVEYFAVGRSATVLLSDEKLVWQLRTNGLPEAGIIRPGTWHNRYALTHWLTALPVLARPDTRSMLVVGLGGGSALETVPASVDRIDVVELEPEVIEANRAVADARWRDPLSDPRIHLHVNDARNALLLAERGFDAIVSQPSHPFASGAAHLYTQEFFELVRDRLSQQGVFVQWVGLPFVDEPLLRSLLAALDAAFPHVRVYRPPPGSGVLFLASRAPLDVERTAGLAIAGAPDEFGLMGIRMPEDVTARLVLDEPGVRALAQGAPPNRDGHNRLQSRSANLGPRSLNLRFDDVVADQDPLARARSTDGDFYFLVRSLDAPRAARVAEAIEDPLERNVAGAIAGIAAGARSGPRSALEEALAESPRHEEARAALLRLSVRKVSTGKALDELLESPFSEAEQTIARAWQAREQDDDGAALAALEPALAAIAPRHPLAVEAIRLRIDWRLRGGEPDAVSEAVALADENLGTSPRPAALLLRARAYAAAGNDAAVLDTLQLLGDRLDRSSPVAAAYLRNARQLARATSPDPELVWMRARAELALAGRR